VNRLIFTGCAFSGGSGAGDFPGLDLTAEEVCVAVGVVEGAGASLPFLSVVEGVAVVVGTADVNALDCAQDGSANKATTVMANARRFISLESLPWSSKLKLTTALIRTLRGAQVLTGRFEIDVTQAVSFRYIGRGRYRPIAGLL